MIFRPNPTILTKVPLLKESHKETKELVEDLPTYWTLVIQVLAINLSFIS
jgi:hypothetical protein